MTIEDSTGSSRIFEKTLALTLSLLVVISVFSYVGLSPVGVAAADGTLLEDFEDGDTSMSVGDWSGWSPGMDVTTDSINGSHSGVITTNGAIETSNISSSTTKTPSRIGVKLRASDVHAASTDHTSVIIYSGTNWPIRFALRGGGTVTTFDGASNVDTGEDWHPGQTMYLEARNIDYSSETFDLYVNGKDTGTYNFHDSASGIDKIRMYHDTDDGTSSVSGYIDDVELDGSAYDIPSPSSDIHDFESGSTNVTSTGWNGFHGDTGSLSVSSSPSLSGSFSGALAPTTSTTQRRVDVVADQDITASSVSSEMMVQTVTGDANDEADMYISSDGTIQLSVELQGDGTFVIGNGTGTDTWDVDTWEGGVVYNPTVLMNYDNDSFEVEFNGSTYGPFPTRTAVSSIDEIIFASNAESGSSGNDLYFDEIKINQAGSDLNGTVVNQYGDPVSNATVQVWGVDYDQISGGKSTATDLIEDAKNKTPTEWVDQIESDFRLTGSGGHFQEPDVVYAAVHSVDDWKISRTTDQVRNDPTLESPILSVDASRGETVSVAVSAWDGDKFELRNAISPVRNDLHGEPIEGSIVIETLVAPDDTLGKTQTTPTEINCNFVGCDWSSSFVEVQLTPGFYRVYVEGHAEDSYVIKVGDPVEIIVEDLKNEQKQAAEQAAEVTQNLNEGKFTKTTTTTASDGSWSVDVGTNVKTVAIQAYKAPDVEVNDSDLTYEDIILEYEAAYEDGQQVERLGSVYLPSEVISVDPPQSDVTLTVQETTFPELADRENLEEWLRDILEEMLNESLSDTTSAFQNRTEDVARSELESTYETLVDMYQNNAALRAIVDGLAEESDRELVIRENLDDVSDSQMRDTVDLIYEGLSLLGGSGGGSVDPVVGNDTISQVWTLPGDIDNTSINLLIHWSNGTTDSLSTESEYLSLNKRTGLTDQVVLDEYPIGDEDPSSLTFELLYVTDDGQPGRDRNTIRNPRFDGDIPSLDAIELTSLEPGPSDQVDITIHPKDAARFGSIVSATVTGPGGSDISTDAISSNGRATGFKTGGSGVYHVALTFNNSDGDEFTETIRVLADDFNDQRPPSAQVKTGPTGRYLVVGDGLESGSIDVSDAGEVSVAARISQDSDVPGSVQLYLQEVDTGSRTEVTVSVVRGETESRVNQRVGLILHMNHITETAVLYREGDEPLPRNGSNAAGEVNARENGSTIQSFTEDDGKVTVLVENDPSFVERVLYRIRGLDIPIVSVAPVSDLADRFLEPVGAASQIQGAIP